GSRGCSSTARRKWRSARLKLPAWKCFLPRLRSLSGKAFAAAAAGGARGGGLTLPGVAGSSWTAAPVSAFDWNRSPSLVELSQPVSHNRHGTVPRGTRAAFAPIDGVPRRPSIGLRPPRRKHTTLRPSQQTGDFKLGDDG